jgi:hypothetical protein
VGAYFILSYFECKVTTLIYVKRLLEIPRKTQGLGPTLFPPNWAIRVTHTNDFQANFPHTLIELFSVGNKQ